MRNARDLLAACRVPIILVGIVGVGLCFRLWNIEHLFNAVHDYDPGVHALAGRFITEGYIPYQDFAQVHPPLYDFVLAALYKVLGYEFLYGRYLSVCLSLASLVLVYFLGRRLYSRRVGAIAALLFAVEPMMVYFGRRCVQEALGLLLVLVAVTIAVRYLEQRRTNLLLWCGFVLGLAISAKYVFVPVAVAIACGLAILSLPNDMWRSIRRIGSLRFWGAYFFVAAMAYALIFFLRLVMRVPVPLPFIDPLFAAPSHMTVCLLVFVVPLLVLWRWWMPGLEVGKWLHALVAMVVDAKLWLLAVGVVAGFVLVTGYFWVTMPGDYLQQTVLWQMGRVTTEVPSLVGIARISFLTSGFFRMSLLSIMLIVPLCVVLVNRPSFGRSDCFLVVTIAVILLLSQGFYQLPRYYASALLLALIGLASLAPGLPNGQGYLERIGSLAVVAVLVLSVSLSLGLLNNYSGYDVASPIGPTERDVYDRANAILEEDGAEKVFSTNPIYPALSGDYESSLSFDTFAVLFLENTPADEVVAAMKEEGVDHVIIDGWARFWEAPPYRDLIQDVVHEVRSQGSLVALIQPDTDERAEVYRLDGPGESLVNGDFRYWSSYKEVPFPLGWNPVLTWGPDDGASIARGGVGDLRWVELSVYENGGRTLTCEATHAGIRQRIAFPRQDIVLEVMPGINTEAVGSTPLGPAVHFLDGDGHDLTIGFSDEVEEELVSVCEDCPSAVVIRPAPLHQWSEHRISLAEYWRETGWPLPDELTVLVVLSAHSDYPGYYTFHVARVDTVQP